MKSIYIAAKGIQINV